MTESENPPPSNPADIPPMQTSAGSFTGPETGVFTEAEAQASAGTFTSPGLIHVSDQPRPDPPPFQRDYRQAAPPFFLDQNELWSNKAVQQNRRNFAATIATDAAGSPPFEGTGHVASHLNVIAVSIEIIRRRLQERPDDIRAAAWGYANAFKEHARELREGKIPNEADQLAQYKSLLDFLEQMAAGLAELADALDRAISSATGSPASSPEPIFLGKAAEIARWLQGRTHQWLEEIGTDVIGVPVRIGVLLTGIEFLHLLGADSAAAIGALWLTCQGKKRKSA